VPKVVVKDLKNPVFQAPNGNFLTTSHKKLLTKVDMVAAGLMSSNFLFKATFP
jgi:hypothetical protein